jgi:hypothetical protein
LARVQREYADALPHIEACAHARFRRVRDPGTREDAIANVIAIAWQQWVSAIRHRKDPNEFIGSIADKAIRRVRVGRRLDRQESANDVLSPRAQRGRGFSVAPLTDDFADDVPGDRSTPPQDQAAFREQYSILLNEMSPRKRSIVEDLAAGGETVELAAQHNVTPGRISQVRREAERAWRRIEHEERER